MKLLAKDILFSLVMGLLLPGMLLNFGAALLARQSAPSVPARESAPEPGVLLEARVHRENGETETVDMDAYLVGVVLAEMPAWFQLEALKAQVVVARTYARKALETGGKHGDGSVCTDPACCQGWQDTADYLEAGGTAEDVEKVRRAVQETSGQVLTYEGQLIEATYFSCSGGSTEAAVAVWGTDFPYLQAVESPGEEDAKYYRDSCCISRRELENRLQISLEGAPDQWVSDMTLTEGDGVESVTIGDQRFTGTQLRSLLGLRSASFSVEPGVDSLTFLTRGYGHRVGMSQYGADAMASGGSSCEQILSHYYRGAELIRISE